jgi:DNA mismatch repair ATPase MutS
MNKISILFSENSEENAPQNMNYELLHDLAIDQLVGAITFEKQVYNLNCFFYAPLHDKKSIEYRQDVMRDFENKIIFTHINNFSQNMKAVHDHIKTANEMSYKNQKNSFLLDAIYIYCNSVLKLADGLAKSKCNSNGINKFIDFMKDYTTSNTFKIMKKRVDALKIKIASIRYTIFADHFIVVNNYRGQADFTKNIKDTFSIFDSYFDGCDYDFNMNDSLNMNHVEEKILDIVEVNNKALFNYIDEFCNNNLNFIDDTIANFDRESQFYISYFLFIAAIKKSNLQFCYPQISTSKDESYCLQTFDLALAHKLISENATPVCNDFQLMNQEQMLVITGANQGGKTTFARTIGQLHYFASLGLPIPGREAKLHLFDAIFTHFEREEHLATLRGKLQDDLVRIHAILKAATRDSIVIINEIFASTTFRDALSLSRRIAGQLMALGLRCVWVTFIDELASMSEKAVSMVSTVEPGNPAQRTYKIVRQTPDGLAYAVSIAEKYRLTYGLIKERIHHEHPPVIP